MQDNPVNEERIKLQSNEITEEVLIPQSNPEEEEVLVLQDNETAEELLDIAASDYAEAPRLHLYCILKHQILSPRNTQQKTLSFKATPQRKKIQQLNR